MSKITLGNVVNLQTSSNVTTINNNSAILQTAMDNTLSRDGTSPNQMGSNLDMNNFRIINLPAAASNNDPVRLNEFNLAVFGTAAPGSSGQVPYNNAGTLTAMSGVSWFNSIQTLAVPTIIANQFVQTTVNVQTGTTYSLASTDNGRIITLNNTSSITLTLPAGLGAAFTCNLVQLGTGQVGLVTSGTTLHSVGSSSHLSGQYAVGTLITTAADVFNFSGQIA